MSARLKGWLDIEQAARIAYKLPLGWRMPPTDEIEQQRATEAREDARREADEYTATGHTDNDWES
jgi:hypothetical protein